MKQKKVGLLGGTFDPVHRGHLAVAWSVLTQRQLDEILFIPAWYPPHKKRELTPFAHRVGMLEAALGDSPYMSVSIIEAERDAPSYTVDTLEELHKRLESCRFYLIMGADMFTEIHLWFRYYDLFRLSDIIVAARPGIGPEVVARQVGRLPGKFSYDTAMQCWRREDGFTVYFCADVDDPVSSSDVRERIARGMPVAGYLDPRVQEYIEKNNLYSGSP